MVNATKGEDLYAEAQGRAIQEQRRSLFRKNNKTVKFKEFDNLKTLFSSVGRCKANSYRSLYYQTLAKNHQPRLPLQQSVRWFER